MSARRSLTGTSSALLVALTLVLGVVIVAPGSARAEATIESYDIQQTPVSGWGLWTHSYAGTIMDTGRTADYGWGPFVIADYSGGSGTLNDEVVPMTTDNNHLFMNGSVDVNEVPVWPTITLHLSESVCVEKIFIYGGNVEWNAFPGALKTIGVGIGGSSVSLATSPFGWEGVAGPVNDLVDLTGTPLSAIPTSSIVLTDFTAEWFGYPLDQFCIGEITVNEEAQEPIQVSIDVKPGDDTNTVNLNRGGVPVAILGSEAFSVLDIDRSTLTFGVTGFEHSLLFTNRPSDLNGDGIPDLLCHFDTTIAQFQPWCSQMKLVGNTNSGVYIWGTDTVLTRR